MNTTTKMNTTQQKSIYRFAPGTDHKRTAIALQDGRFLEVKPIRQMFANGDAWSASFMGEGSRLSDGVTAGKITVETSTVKTPKKESRPPLNIDREIAQKKKMVANMTAKYAEMQTEMRTIIHYLPELNPSELYKPIKQLAELNQRSHSLDLFRKGIEKYLEKLQQQQNAS